MDENMRSRLAESVRRFHIPRLGEIPDVGLYLEQVTRYVNQSITGCGLSPITASMVSNYVKQKIIPGPEKKAYGAESIAYLIFVSCIKSVVAMDDIRALIGIQHETYDLPTAYHYFCEEFENLIRYVFGASDHLASVGQDESDEKELLRSALLSASGLTEAPYSSSRFSVMARRSGQRFVPRSSTEGISTFFADSSFAMGRTS